MEQINCLLCDNSEYRPIIRGRDRLLGLPGEFTVVECRKCGLRFTNPRPSMDELAYYYPENYGPYKVYLSDSDSQDDTLLERFKTRLKQLPLASFMKKLNNPRLTFIPNLPDGAKVLELGCATGWFLNDLHKNHWDLYGVELSKTSATYAREELGLNVFCGTLEGACFPSNYFDAIFAWHVIEHLPNPLGTLKEMNRVLKKDGYFVFSAPNVGCWEFYVFKSKWYALDLPRHLFHFSVKSINKVLKAGNFRLEKVFYQKNINNIVGSLAYCLEDAVGENSVSKYLRTHPQSNNRLSRLFSKSLAIFLSIIRQGGRMTLVCRGEKYHT